MADKIGAKWKIIVLAWLAVAIVGVGEATGGSGTGKRAAGGKRLGWQHMRHKRVGAAARGALTVRTRRLQAPTWCFGQDSIRVQIQP